MKKVLSQFENKITVDELIKTVQSELKASNISSSAADILFKNYPTEASDDEGITSDILNSNLNTIVFDTELNRVTIYITTEAGIYTTKEKTDELEAKVDLLRGDLNDNNQIIVGINKTIDTIKDINESNKLKFEAQSTKNTELDESIASLQGKVQTNEQKYALANTAINELKNKNTEFEGKFNDYALKSKVSELEQSIAELKTANEQLKAEIEALKNPSTEGDV